MNPQQNDPINTIPTNNIPPVNNFPPVSVPPVNFTPVNGHGKIGPIIVTLVIVILVVIGLLYVFAPKSSPSTENSNTQQMTTDDQTPAVDTSQSLIPETQPSTIQSIDNKADDLQSIQDDLNMSIEGLESQAI